MSFYFHFFLKLNYCFNRMEMVNDVDQEYEYLGPSQSNVATILRLRG